MKLQNLIIGIIVLSMCILGMSTFMMDTGVHYNTTADYSTINHTASFMNEKVIWANDIKDQIKDMKLDPTLLLEVPYVMIQVGWAVVKSPIDAITTVETISSDATSIMASNGIILPGWLIPGLVAILTITVIFMLVYMFFKWKVEN